MLGDRRFLNVVEGMLLSDKMNTATVNIPHTQRFSLENFKGSKELYSLGMESPSPQMVQSNRGQCY